MIAAGGAADAGDRPLLLPARSTSASRAACCSRSRRSAPGFTADEPLEHLGEKLILPPNFEQLRDAGRADADAAAEPARGRRVIVRERPAAGERGGRARALPRPRRRRARPLPAARRARPRAPPRRLPPARAALAAAGRRALVRRAARRLSRSRRRSPRRYARGVGVARLAAARADRARRLLAGLRDVARARPRRRAAATRGDRRLLGLHPGGRRLGSSTPSGPFPPVALGHGTLRPGDPGRVRPHRARHAARRRRRACSTASTRCRTRSTRSSSRRRSALAVGELANLVPEEPGSYRNEPVPGEPGSQRNEPGSRSEPGSRVSQTRHSFTGRLGSCAQLTPATTTSPRDRSPKSASFETIATTSQAFRFWPSSQPSGFFACRGFCLMPTHYHLLAWFETDMLPVAIHRLNRRYAGGFNRRHSRRGHVFDSPYTSVFVEDDVHYRWLDEYIAANPGNGPGRGARTTPRSHSSSAEATASAS